MSILRRQELSAENDVISPSSGNPWNWKMELEKQYFFPAYRKEVCQELKHKNMPICIYPYDNICQAKLLFVRRHEELVASS